MRPTTAKPGKVDRNLLEEQNKSVTTINPRSKMPPQVRIIEHDSVTSKSPHRLKKTTMSNSSAFKSKRSYNHRPQTAKNMMNTLDYSEYQLKANRLMGINE